MTLNEHVFTQAALLAGQLEARETEILRALCTAVTASLAARLRKGLSPENCKADFIAAASLFALSALDGMERPDQVEQFRIGDVTVSPGGRDAASNCLRLQAESLIAPYLQDRFTFRGV